MHVNSFKYKSKRQPFQKTLGFIKSDDELKWLHKHAHFHRCVLVPGLYCEVDCSSESNQVDFCLVKDGNLFTIFGEKREKEKETEKSKTDSPSKTKGGFCMSIN